jgi:hypothetical protein
MIYTVLFAAESTYRLALLADPNHVATLNNLGHLVHTHHNNMEEAEALYRCQRFQIDLNLLR